MRVIEQLCIKSFMVTDDEGGSWKAEQGKFYTTSEPDAGDVVIVFSNFWVPVPKSHFVISEKVGA